MRNAGFGKRKITGILNRIPSGMNMSTEPQRFPYPGTPTTADGSAVVVWIESNISEGACAYPITPSTNMGSGYQLAVANGCKNLWERDLFFLEPESEHSSALSLIHI